MRMQEILILLLIGLVGGFFGGTLGLGGGAIIVPALVMFMGMSQHEAQGTSLGMMVLPVAAAAAFNYYQKGYINTKYVFVIMIAFVVGGYLGSLLSVHLPANILKKLFGVFLILIALKMIFSK